MPKQRLPTTRQLQYLCALHQYRHFGKAAKSCFISQSAFSTAIKALENLLDVSLIDRSNRRLVFTPAGKIIEAQGRQALSVLEDMVDLAKSVSKPFSGILRLGIIPTIAPFLLPKLLPSIKQYYPKLDLHIREEQTRILYEQLMLGELDMVLYAQPYDFPHTNTAKLCDDGFHFAYAGKQNHAKFSPLKQINFNDLDSDALLLLEDGHCLRDHVLTVCKLNDKAPINQYSASSLQTLVQLVDNQMGFTLLPNMAIPHLALAETNIQTLPLAAKHHRTIALAWRDGSSRFEEFEAIAATIKQAV